MDRETGDEAGVWGSLEMGKLGQNSMGPWDGLMPVRKEGPSFPDGTRVLLVSVQVCVEPQVCDSGHWGGPLASTVQHKVTRNNDDPELLPSKTSK